MKKYMKISSILFVGCFILMACSNDNSNQNNDGTAEENEIGNQAENNNTDDTNLDNDDKEIDDSADGDWGEDELGLGIGYSDT